MTLYLLGRWQWAEYLCLDADDPHSAQSIYEEVRSWSYQEGQYNGVAARTERFPTPHDARGGRATASSPSLTMCTPTRAGSHVADGSPCEIRRSETDYSGSRIAPPGRPNIVDRAPQVANPGKGYRSGLPVTPPISRVINSFNAPGSKSPNGLPNRTFGRTPVRGDTGSVRDSRPISPATSICSTRSNVTRLNNGRRSLIPVASPSAAFQRSTTRMSSSPPPVPALPSRASIADRERDLRATHLRAIAQTPEPTLRARASQMPFYSGRRNTSNQLFGTSTPGSGSPSRDRTTSPEKKQGDSRSTRGSAPSAWKEQPHTRPGSSMSIKSRAGSATPLPMSRSYKGFVPNPLDSLDVELANILESIPNDVVVERLDPPLRKGQRHEGEWRAQYGFSSGRHGRRIYPSRLLELHKPRTANEKVRKVMVRVDGLWRDVRLVLLEMA